MSYGTNPDGTVYVRQESAGDLTRFAFSSTGHTITITFRPSEEYDLADVEDTFARADGDIFIEDFESALDLWAVEYAVSTYDKALVL